MADWHASPHLPEKEAWWNPTKPWHYVVALGGSLIAVGMGWYYMGQNPQHLGGRDIPVLMAEPGPVRMASDQYDKPMVPHQEKLLYEKLDPTGALEKVLKLAPSAETPLDLQEALGLSQEMTWDLSPKEEGFFVDDDMNAPKVTLPKTPVKSDKATGKTGPVVATGKSGVFKGKYWVQLAVASSQKEANAHWQVLKKKHRSILCRYHPQIVRVDLGKGKGMKYQVHLGHFADLSTADKLCQNLQEKGSTCIVGRG